jgi:hypothetical protein
MVHQDPVEVRGDDHLLATVADPGHPLANALTDIVDEEAAERDQCPTIDEPWLGQQDSLQRGPTGSWFFHSSYFFSFFSDCLEGRMAE